MAMPKDEELQVPDFKPRVPEYILAEIKPSEKYMLESLSELQQKTDWQSEVLKHTYNEAREAHTQAKKTNGRVNVIEDAVGKLQKESELLSEYVPLIAFSKKKYGKVILGLSLFLSLFVIYPYILSLGLDKILETLISFL